MTKRVGIFGGSFSPPHLGHFHAAQTFLEAEKLDHLYIIPAFISPGKQSTAVSAEDRLEMCRLAFASLPHTEVLDIEILRGGNSYTADTLASLYREGEQLVVLCGTDTALALDRWYRPDLLFSYGEFVLMPRTADTELALHLKEKNQLYKSKYGGTVKLLDATAYPLSSTYVREKIKEGDKAKCAECLAPSVLDYIFTHGLYGA